MRLRCQFSLQVGQVQFLKAAVSAVAMGVVFAVSFWAIRGQPSHINICSNSPAPAEIFIFHRFWIKAAV
jgi:hypothetical protein